MTSVIWSSDSHGLEASPLSVSTNDTVMCCEYAIFIHLVVSSLICFLPGVLKKYTCCLIALLNHVIIVAFLVYSSWRDGRQHQNFTCTQSLVSGCLFLLIWAFAAYMTHHPLFWCFDLLDDNFMHAVGAEYQRMLLLMPGPTRECYESTFFRKKCEDGLREVIDDRALSVSSDDMVMAGQQISLSPWFLDSIFVRPLRLLHSGKTLSRPQAVRVLRLFYIHHLEQSGSYVPEHYHYNVLQLPVDGTNIVIAKRRYEDLCARWSMEGSENEMSTNMELLRHSFDVVAQHLKTKYLKHPG